MSYYRSRSGATRPARIAIIAIFLAFRLVDAVTYFSVPPEARGEMLGSTFLGLMWTTVFLVAVWYRQAWARYVLATLLFLSALFACIALSEFVAEKISIPGLLLFTVVVDFAIMLVLIYLPSLRAYTRR